MMFALETTDGDVFTLGGEILVHDNPAELEFLFPGRKAKDVSATRWPTRPWKDHPEMAGIRWPLRREDFR
jgi:hypothetical protein